MGFPVWPTVESIPSPVDNLAGASGTGRDTTGGQGGHDRPEGLPERGAGGNPAADLGFSGDPAQRGDVPDDMMHAQRVWDATLAANRLDDLGLDERRRAAAGPSVTAGLLVDGRPDAARACVEALVEHTGAHVLALDLGDVDGAGTALQDVADRHAERVTAWHVAERPAWLGGTATLDACRTKLLELDTAEVHVFVDLDAVVAEGDLAPLVAELGDGHVARRSSDGGLLAVDRAAALERRR